MPIEVCASNQIANLAAQRIAEALERAVSSTGGASLALAGGTTPRAAYEALAKIPGVDWARINVYFGDERAVPPTHPDSNFQMAQSALFERVALPPANIHRIHAEQVDQNAAARAYELILPEHISVMVLGIGEDGHTASLFPGTTALDEREKWAAAVVGAKSEARITLTYPALESSRHAAFLLEGSGKTAIFQKIRAGDDSFPAARLHPVGQLRWFLDKAAAGEALG